MLDDGGEVVADVESYLPRTPWAKENEHTMYEMNDAKAGQEETCYFLKLKTGKASLINRKIGKKFSVIYSLDTLPCFVEWKSMASGDYALGLEPCTTELDDKFAYKTLKAGEEVRFSVALCVEKIV